MSKCSSSLHPPVVPDIHLCVLFLCSILPQKYWGSSRMTELSTGGALVLYCTKCCMAWWVTAKNLRVLLMLQSFYVLKGFINRTRIDPCTRWKVLLMFAPFLRLRCLFVRVYTYFVSCFSHRSTVETWQKCTMPSSTSRWSCAQTCHSWRETFLKGWVWLLGRAAKSGTAQRRHVGLFVVVLADMPPFSTLWAPPPFCTA